MKTQKREPIIEVVLCRNKLTKTLCNFHFEMSGKRKCNNVRLCFVAAMGD